MKKEISPAIMWITVVVVAALVVFCGFRFMNGPPPNADKKGADENMKKVQAGLPMYTPPPGAVNNGPGGSSGSMPAGGYVVPPPGR